MAEDLDIVEGTKQEKYAVLYPQLEALLEGENDLIANLANVSAALKEMFEFLWVGFYFVKGDNVICDFCKQGEPCQEFNSIFSILGKYLLC